MAGLPATAAAPLGTQQPAAAGTAVLVGLKPGASLRMSTQGVTASDSAVAQSLRALSVQSAVWLQPHGPRAARVPRGS
jgi:hypothetical protein